LKNISIYKLKSRAQAWRSALVYYARSFKFDS